MVKIDSAYLRIAAAFDHLRDRLLRRAYGDAVMVAAAWFLVWFSGSVLVIGSAVLSPSGIAAHWIALLCGAVICPYVVLRPTWPPAEPRAMALYIEERLGGFGNLLVTAVELAARPGRESAEITAEITRRADAAVDAIDPATLVPPRRRETLLKALQFIALVTLLTSTARLANTGHTILLLSGRIEPATSPAGDGLTLAGDITVVYTYPAYTLKPPYTVEGSSGELRALKGSVAAITARPLAENVAAAELLVGTGASVTAFSWRILPDGRITGAVPMLEDTSYRLCLRLRNGDTLISRKHGIKVDPDLFPSLTLIGDAVEKEINGDETLTIGFKAEDDFGLDEIRLVYSASGTGEDATVRVINAHVNAKRAGGAFDWDLKANPIGAKPGERIAYHLEATDNDVISGPKIGRSETRYLKIFWAREFHNQLMAQAREIWEAYVEHLAWFLENGPVHAPGALAPPPATAAAQMGPPAADAVAGYAARTEGLDKTSARLLRLVQEFRDKDTVADPKVTAAFELVARDLGDTGRRARLAHDQLAARLAMGRAISAALWDNGAEWHAKLIAALERHIIYMEDLIDRERAEELLALANQLMKEQETLTALLQELKRTGDEKIKQQLLERIQRMKAKIQDLMAEMAKLSRGIRDEFLNAEAMEKLSLGEEFAKIEELLNQGDVEAAGKELDELAKQLQQMTSGLRDMAAKLGSEKYAGMQARIDKLQADLRLATELQEKLLADTEKKTEAARRQMREDMAKKWENRRDELLRKAEAMSEALQAVPQAAMRDAVQRRVEEGISRALELRELLKAGDLFEARETVRSADRDLANLDLFAQGPEEQRRSAQGKLREAKQNAAEIREALEDMFAGLRQEPSKKDLADLRQFAGRQQDVQQKTQRVRDELEALNQELPLMGPGMRETLDEAQGHMGEAQSALERGDPMEAQGSERQALKSLQGLAEQMQGESEAQRMAGGIPMPMGTGGQGQGDNEGGGEGTPGFRGRNPQDREPVEIPKAEEYVVPDAFRKDILDAMKQPVPEPYKEQVRQYYEDLVK